MIKKISEKDKKDWLYFLERKEKLFDKDHYISNKQNIKQEKTIDLHGCSLENANKIISEFINSCYRNKIEKIKIITGKGSRSQSKANPYQSKDLSLLKYSVPNYIKNDTELMQYIKFINYNDIDNVLKGSFEIILKKFKE